MGLLWSVMTEGYVDPKLVQWVLSIVLGLGVVFGPWSIEFKERFVVTFVLLILIVEFWRWYVSHRPRKKKND